MHEPCLSKSEKAHSNIWLVLITEITSVKDQFQNGALNDNLNVKADFQIGVQTEIPNFQNDFQNSAQNDNTKVQ